MDEKRSRRRWRLGSNFITEQQASAAPLPSKVQVAQWCSTLSGIGPSPEGKTVISTLLAAARETKSVRLQAYSLEAAEGVREGLSIAASINQLGWHGVPFLLNCIDCGEAKECLSEVLKGVVSFCNGNRKARKRAMTVRSEIIELVGFLFILDFPVLRALKIVREEFAGGTEMQVSFLPVLDKMIDLTERTAPFHVTLYEAGFDPADADKFKGENLLTQFQEFTGITMRPLRKE